MSKPVEPYTHRDYEYVELPPRIRTALGMHPGHFRGRLFVWATSAAAAYRFLEPLGIEDFRSPRFLKPATQKAARTLHRAYRWPPGTILVNDSSGLAQQVLRVEFTEHGGYDTYPVAELDHGYCGITLADELRTEVTQDMVDAARNVLADYGETLPVHTALVAALRAKRG